MKFDQAKDVFSASKATQSSSKLDYLAWQDSIAKLRRAFVFNTATVPAGAMPPELIGYTVNPSLASGFASDHRPVIADFQLAALTPCLMAVQAHLLGGAKPGGLGICPTFVACGSFAAGETATLRLEDVPPFAGCYLVLSFTQGSAPLLGGELIPIPPSIFGPFRADAQGVLTIEPIGGGGGPFTLYLQYGIEDPSASFGVSFSNALEIEWP